MQIYSPITQARILLRQAQLLLALRGEEQSTRNQSIAYITEAITLLSEQPTTSSNRLNSYIEASE